MEQHLVVVKMEPILPIVPNPFLVSLQQSIKKISPFGFCEWIYGTMAQQQVLKLFESSDGFN
jgi:hypothetical protein